MGWFRDRVERRLGLGIADEPRRVGVEAKARRVDLEVRSTPGARVRLVRDGRDGEVQLLLLWCLRRGIAVELVGGEPAIEVDGRRVAAEEARALLSRDGPAAAR